MKTHVKRIRRNRAGLVVIDIQERLLPAIHQPERLVGNSLRLITGLRLMGVPVFVTEQYPKGLGGTVSKLADALSTSSRVEKLAFSACGELAFALALRNSGVSDAILCGMEAHVCVLQTCLDLLDQEFRVFVVADAVSSRTPENREIALDRMRDAGAVVVSTEMVLFELLGRAGTQEFKQVQALLK